MTIERRTVTRAWFWSHVLRWGREDECWPWTGPTSKGYGQISETVGVGTARRTYAHRQAWIFEHGPIPAGLWVLHTCDNPPCCRPDHLYLGTAIDNARDMVRRGRDGKPAAKITPDVAARIRSDYNAAPQPRRRGDGGPTIDTLGRAYGLSRSAVGAILRGESWARTAQPDAPQPQPS